MIQTATFVSVVLLAVLTVLDGGRPRIGRFDVLAMLVGIAGLVSLSVAISIIHAWQREPRAGSDSALLKTGSAFNPLMVEIALWILAVAYVFRLADIAHG